MVCSSIAFCMLTFAHVVCYAVPLFTLSCVVWYAILLLNARSNELISYGMLFYGGVSPLSCSYLTKYYAVALCTLIYATAIHYSCVLDHTYPCLMIHHVLAVCSLSVVHTRWNAMHQLCARTHVLISYGVPFYSFLHTHVIWYDHVIWNAVHGCVQDHIFYGMHFNNCVKAHMMLCGILRCSVWLCALSHEPISSGMLFCCCVLAHLNSYPHGMIFYSCVSPPNYWYLTKFYAVDLACTHVSISNDASCFTCVHALSHSYLIIWHSVAACMLTCTNTLWYTMLHIDWSCMISYPGQMYSLVRHA